MTSELLVSATPYGLRAAEIANGRVRAFHVESAARPGRVGDIVWAGMRRAAGGLEATFLDIGDERAAYLEKAVASGDRLLVQITRGPFGRKGARVSDRPKLVGRYVVFDPHGTKVSVSRQLDDDTTRRRLGDLAGALSGGEGAFTVRTAAAAVDDALIRAEAERLRQRWSEIKRAIASQAAPACLDQAGGLLTRLLRDIAPPDIAHIRFDDRRCLAHAREVAGRDMPDLMDKLEAFEPADALFDLCDAAQAFEAALMPVVALPSGGRLTIEPTNALVAIDVDTAGATGAHRRDSTLRAACREAANRVAHEIVLRNLAGLIVVDFPHLPSVDDRRQLSATMTAALDDDRTPHAVVGMTPSSLMEITRRRVGEPLLDALTEPVSGETYGGRIRRVDAVAFDIAQAAAREARAGARRIVVHAASEVIAYMESGAPSDRPSDSPHSLAEWLGAAIVFEVEPAAGREDWRVDGA